MDVHIEPTWKAVLQGEFEKEYFARLALFVRGEYLSHRCYPPAGSIFSAFDLCPFPRVRVVILGQDPYHEAGQAEGLCFSVRDGTPPPPSLVNIFKEVLSDVGHAPPLSPTAQQQGEKRYSGSLQRWAEQGVLLLNTTLTVREHMPSSHQRHGWETFTDAVIRVVAQQKEHVVFLLWGAVARSKAPLIDQQKHLILVSAHPSPLSACRGGWFGNRHFSQCNRYLEAHHLAPIYW